MDLTLDYNIELFPLQKDQSFALALASSLAKGISGAVGGAADGTDDADDKDRDVWRPDGKGRRGLEEDYDYVMYGKASDSTKLFRNTSPLTFPRSHTKRFTNSTEVLRKLCTSTGTSTLPA